MRFKIFTGTNRDKLEGDVNAWLDQLPGKLSIRSTQTAATQLAAEGMPTRPVLIITIWYE
jgi:hypothetical protein